MRTNRIRISLSLLILVSMACISGCGRPNLFSAWRSREITIDGKYTDWGNYTVYYNEKAKMVVNLLNDREYLYICLISRNRDIESRIMESGLILWFDPGGGKNKAFGIRFPIGLSKMGMSLEDKDKKDMDADRDWRYEEDRSGQIDRGKERLTDKDFNRRLETIESLQDRLEVISEDGSLSKQDSHSGLPPKEAGKKDLAGRKMGRPGNLSKGRETELSLEKAGELGIEAKVGRENDYFVYELKVPLAKSVKCPYAIEVKTDKPLGLGLEIPVFNHDLTGAGSLRMPASGDGSDRMPSRMGEAMFYQERFQLWVTVVISRD